MSDIKHTYPYPYGIVLVDEGDKRERERYESLYRAALFQTGISDSVMDTPEDNPAHVTIRFRQEKARDTFSETLHVLMKCKTIQSDKDVQKPPAQLRIAFNFDEEQFPNRYEYKLPAEDDPKAWADSIHTIMRYKEIHDYHLLYAPDNRVMTIYFKDDASYTTFMNVGSPKKGGRSIIQAVPGPAPAGS